MPALGPAVICKYAGLIPLHIHTYTQAYPSFGGGNWDFNNSAMSPMEFRGFIAGVPLKTLPSGFFARLIDLNTGYTTISAGDNTPGHLSPIFGEPCWQDDIIGGWAYGHITEKNPVTYSYSARLGNSYIAASFDTYAGLRLSKTLPNTQAPYPYTNANWPCANGGRAGSVEINLNPFNYVAKDSGIIGGFGFDIGTVGYIVQNAIGPYQSPIYGEWSFVQVENPVNLADRHRLLYTDFLGGTSSIYEVHLENPIGASLNIDTLVTNYGNGVPSATDAGWLLISKLALTIGSVVCNGFAVLISPDYLQYFILQIIPHDAVSAGWQAMVGTFTAKIDRSGAVWMKNSNIANTLFVSAGNVLKQLPIFYPVPLADSVDVDPVVQMMRSFQP